MERKSNLLLILVLLAVVSVWTVYRQFVKSKELPTISSEPAKPTGQMYRAAVRPVKLAPKQIESLDRLLQQSSAVDSKKSGAVDKAPAYCKTQWERLTGIDALRWYDSISGTSQDDWLNCLSILPNSSGLLQLVRATCQKDEQGKEANRALCVATVVMYRAFLLDILTKDDLDYAKMDVGLLVNKFAGRIMQGDEVYKPSLVELNKITDQIIRLQPQNSSSYKFPALLALMTDDYVAAGSWAKNGLEKNPNDPVLKDILYLYQSLNDLPALQARIQAAPDDDVAAYNWAAHLWRDGKVAEARALLAKLANQHPEVERYAISLAESKKTEEFKRIFAITIPLIDETW